MKRASTLLSTFHIRSNQVDRGSQKIGASQPPENQGEGHPKSLGIAVCPLGPWGTRTLRHHGRKHLLHKVSQP